ncbi:Uncharacterised protein [Mannheimia haemolytica]|uniref:Uncharacterized protein n=1 Tax=Mannheimia haemolytica TaxID=75985 RepID=A0A378MXL7_MANHA|nr:Uncharacterised protein [Mannheimia haemolytica]
MQNFANIEIAFIHRKAPLPSDFSYPEMPGGLTEKQVQKWQSRRVAFFLLTELFKKHHLDLDLLADMQRSQAVALLSILSKLTLTSAIQGNG